MRRSMMLIILTFALWLVPAGAAAGGGNWLEVPYYLPVGTHQIVEPQLVFFRGERAAERAAQKSWSLYLVPATRGWDRVTLTGDSHRFGTLELTTDGNGRQVRASASFTVPELPLGRYSVVFCNPDRCTRHIGDLYAIDTWVVETAGQAALAQRMDRLRGRNASLSYRIRQTNRALKGLETEIAANHVDIVELVSDRDALRARVRDLENAEPAAAGSPLPWAIGTGLLTLVVVIAWRRVRPSDRWEYFEPEEDTQPDERDPAPEGSDPIVQFEALDVPIGRASDVYDDSMWRRPKEPADSI